MAAFLSIAFVGALTVGVSELEPKQTARINHQQAVR
jgi:hypothetical protein